ncbi:alpha/beta fold hydrolase [Streptomyces virginiae]|uniref:S9 family peptidase n=1 Tax=Streptomyces virginiae TaxID=1961 RepID=UPI000B25F57F
MDTSALPHDTSGPDFYAERISFFFSHSGAHAACLVARHPGQWGIQSWTWADSNEPECDTATGATETVYTQPMPLEDGRILLLRTGPGTHELFCLEPKAPTPEAHLVGTIQARGLRLLPSPAPLQVALAIGRDELGNSLIWRVVDNPKPQIVPVPLKRHPSQLTGGIWLDTHGRTLAFNTAGHETTVPVSLNVLTGDDSALEGPVSERGTRIILSSSQSGALLLATETRGRLELAWSESGTSSPLRYFPQLQHLKGRVTPLALSPDGTSLAFKLDQGTKSEIFTCQPEQSDVHRVDMCPGVVLQEARWTPSGLRIVRSAPNQPSTIETLNVENRAHKPASAVSNRAKRKARSQVHTEWLDGPEEKIEAIIYGGDAWREAPKLLLALHGGPNSAWRFDFDPLFQRLSESGIAILAPNQRGSSFYGREYQDAIRGGWGGPDRDDILYIARELANFRRPMGLPQLMLTGTSYGGYLALVAAASSPNLWSHCAVFSAFTSPSSLYAASSPGVRSFLRRLEGCSEDGTARYSPDVVDMAKQLSMNFLIVHGLYDEVVPISEARRLWTALLERVAPQEVALQFLEVDAGHDPMVDSRGKDPVGTLLNFLNG